MIHTLFLLTAQQPAYNGSGPNSWGGRMMYSPFGGWFMTLLAIVAVIILIRILKGSTRGNDHRGEPPLDILKRRYAAGEIDRDTYEMMKRDLKDD